MKSIGLIGGLSWQSTLTYYRLLNDEIARRLGGHHSADLRIWSGDFDPVHMAQLRDDHEWISGLLCDAAVGLRESGADLLVIASNTCHRYADAIEATSGLPLVHIVDATASEVLAKGMSKMLLLGTDYTMSSPQYRDRMGGFGISCAIPEPGDREQVHRIIFDELVRGVIEESSKSFLLDVIASASSSGAEGVILGCTELGLILREDDADIPGLDSTRIHCLAAVDTALD